ncbi:thiamine diphosphokinase [Bifidobacterium canis]|uniref:Thiamine diphosphokinase n=1 Tax=Bifidobacterium canis TaxID=2610880 RepID=A0A7K1J2Q3_9BIFI|nr:thiamine diphosphokinase [Bifidobacterium canis]MUH58819.1 thiamine pyrophosphokinase [Bifidobacterium canis]
MAYTTCVVFGAGEYYDSPYYLPGDAFVVAADGGYDHARELGVHVNVVVGDFDSTEETRQHIDAETVALPPEKDDPDLLSALKVGWNNGAREFHIYGGLGGRVDHTISNIQQLALVASHGGIAYLHGNGQIVTAIHDSTLTFPTHEVSRTQYVSVFAHTDTATGVCERGLKYELNDAQLNNLQVNGLSNEFVDSLEASISVAHGMLTIVFDDTSPLPRLTGAQPHGSLGEPSTSVSSALSHR